MKIVTWGCNNTNVNLSVVAKLQDEVIGHIFSWHSFISVVLNDLIINFTLTYKKITLD